MAAPMNMNPRNAIVGPITIRRVENMSGLNCSVVELDPSMSRNPAIIIAPAAIMRMKFFRRSGRCESGCLSMPLSDGFCCVTFCCAIV